MGISWNSSISAYCTHSHKPVFTREVKAPRRVGLRAVLTFSLCLIKEEAEERGWKAWGGGGRVKLLPSVCKMVSDSSLMLTWQPVLSCMPVSHGAKDNFPWIAKPAPTSRYYWRGDRGWYWQGRFVFSGVRGIIFSSKLEWHLLGLGSSWGSYSCILLTAYFFSRGKCLKIL